MFSLYLLESMTLRQFTRVISPVITFGRAFKLLAFLGQIISLLGSMASLTLVSRQFLAHGRWPKANRLPDLSLAKAAFIHVVNYFTIFRAEAVVFFTHSQLVVKPD